MSLTGYTLMINLESEIPATCRYFTLNNNKNSMIYSKRLRPLFYFAQDVLVESLFHTLSTFPPSLVVKPRSTWTPVPP